ncbi:MAG: hypothetical protein H7A24_01415 [Leptospiraceae bacterium]|nr:hypothetical protein [Leptospiraceae bacterium]MCP5510512.1 hypothetical protein [Leptospiraceae bacterium]
MTTHPVFQSQAYKDLGEFYIYTGEYLRAAQQFEEILNIYSFDVSALRSLVFIYSELEDWDRVILYSKALDHEKKMTPEEYYYFSRAEYELGNYSDALKIIKKLENQKRVDIKALNLWKDLLVLENPNKDLSFLAKYLEKKSDSPLEEKVFWEVISNHGKEQRKSIFLGM